MATFAAPARMDPPGPVTSIISAGGQTIRIDIAALSLSLDDDRGQAQTLTRVATVVAPLADNPSAVAVRQTLRGALAAQPGTRAALILHHARQVWTVTLPAQPCLRTPFAGESPSTVPPGVDYRATLVLVVEQDVAAPNTQATLEMVSLELTMAGQADPGDPSAGQAQSDRAAPENKGSALDRLEFFEMQRGIGASKLPHVEPEPPAGEAEDDTVAGEAPIDEDC